MFSLLHCIANGHKIVALGNLYPSQESHTENSVKEAESPRMGDDAQDLDRNTWDDDSQSYMYQTAGHNLIPLFAEALGIPLYRQTIVGEANDKSLVYQGELRESHDQYGVIPDETEALHVLFDKIKAAHPEVNAVSAGAILSTYQRTRVETVATRLGLTPLSYLWQYPTLPPAGPSNLLDDMKAAGLDVRLIKVASGGLDESHLWSNLLDGQARRKVEKAMSFFGGSVLGEGGEYETMVIKGPSHVWKGRFLIPASDMRVNADSASDGSAWLTFRKNGGQVVPNDYAKENLPTSIVRIPNIWDKDFEKLLEQGLRHDEVRQRRSEEDGEAEKAFSQLATDQPSTSLKPSSRPGELTGSMTTMLQADFANMKIVANLTGGARAETAADQMKSIASSISKILDDLGLSTTSILFTTILLRSMSDFVIVNQIYGKLFTKPNPPARVTIGCPLPPGEQVIVSIVISKGLVKEALHVQSRSYWAPANIGPYSQAVRVPLGESTPTSLTFVAGQIPLVPATMERLKPAAQLTEYLQSFEQRACLSLQHLWRIGQEMRVEFWVGGIAFITSKNLTQQKARMAWKIWRQIHQPDSWDATIGESDEEATVDLWDIRNRGQRSLATEPEPRHLPDFSKIREGPKASASTTVPGFLAVQVDELPKECDVEWQGLGVEFPEADILVDTFETFEIHSFFIASAAKYVFHIGIYHVTNKAEELKDLIRQAMDRVKQKASINSSMISTVYARNAHELNDLGAQIVPCHTVWGREGRRLAAGLIILLDSKK